MKIQFKTCTTMMRALAEGAIRGDLVHANVSPADVKLVRGDIPWMGNQRSLVVNVLESYMFSALDCLGIMRYTVPAEYIAAAIATLVHPTNIAVACVWMESGAPKLDALANPTSSSVNRSPVNSDQLLAIVYGVLTDHSAECKVYTQMFDSRCTVAYLREIEGGKSNDEVETPPQNKHSGKGK